MFLVWVACVGINLFMHTQAGKRARHTQRVWRAWCVWFFVRPAPLWGGTEFPTIYCRWNDGGGGKGAQLNPPTQAILMVFAHHKYRYPAPRWGQAQKKGAGLATK